MVTLVGLETHIQLNTDTKAFCGCPTSEGKPNTQVCEICLGHPGSKPMFNKKVLDYALKLCIALGCKIENEVAFSRKTYFYPDMSKNYQITQFEIPLGRNGSVKLKSGKVVEIERIHIEEDPAALIHDGAIDESDSVLIDYNRSGVPLVEIVTTPCMNSPAEAREFLNELVRIVKYLKIFDERTGVVKSDLNVNIEGHPRVEIKNVSSFKDAERAMNYELVRQKIALKKPGEKKVHTRAWTGRKTTMLRLKENEADYGYIIEPDLPVFSVSNDKIESIRKDVPELAHVRSVRYVEEHKIDTIDAEVLSMELELAELFERVAAEIDPKIAAKWLRHELMRVLNYNKKSLKEVELDEQHVMEILRLVEGKDISERTGQKLMEKLIDAPFSPKEYVIREGLMLVGDDSEIRFVCEDVVKSNEKAVEDYKSGSEKSFNFLVGQVMRITQGKADPAVVNKIMKEVLG